MNVLWILPDGTTIEASVPYIDQLLTTLKMIDSVSVDGISFKNFRTELIIGEKDYSVSVYLNE